MDDSDGVSTLVFPSLPAPLGFCQTVRPGDIPEPAGTSFFYSSPMLPGWYSPAPPDNAQDVLSLSLVFSLIDHVPPGPSGCACLHLLWWRPTILMGTRDCCQLFWALRHSVRRSVRPCRQTYRITVQLTVRPGPLRSALRDLSRVGDWLGRARSCRKFHHRASRVSGMDAPFAALLTGRRITLSPLESMDCHCTTPGFWNGSGARH